MYGGEIFRPDCCFRILTTVYVKYTCVCRGQPSANPLSFYPPVHLTPDEQYALRDKFSDCFAIAYLFGNSNIEAVQKDAPVLISRTWLQKKILKKHYNKLN